MTVTYMAEMLATMNATIDPNITSRSSDNEASYALMRKVCEVMVSFPVAVFGLVGNILAVIVMAHLRPRTTTVVMLLALAAADSTVLVLTILLRSLRYLSWYYIHLEDFDRAYPYIFLTLYPCTFIMRFACSWLTVLLTFDRFIVVCRPLHAQNLCTLKRAYKSTTAVIIIAVLVSIPRFFEYRYDLTASTRFSLTTLVLDNRIYLIVYRIFVFFLFTYFIPTFLMVLLNSYLLLALKKAESYRASLCTQHAADLRNSRSKSRSVTATVVTIVTSTIICNLFAMIAHLLYSLHEGFEDQLAHLESSRRYMSVISNILVTINSAINFSVYSMCSRNFRRMFVYLFHIECICGPPRELPNGIRRSSRSTMSTWASWRRKSSNLSETMITMQNLV